MTFFGIKLRDMIHVIIEHYNMRIVEAAPGAHRVGLIGALREAEILMTVYVPIRRAINAVWIRRLLVGSLQAAPNKMFQIIFHGSNLGVIGKDLVLRSQIGRLAKSGIITGDEIGANTIIDIGLVRREKFAIFHIVWTVKSVEPFGTVLDLLRFHKEFGPLFHHLLGRKNGEVFEIGLAAAIEMDGERIFAQTTELHSVTIGIVCKFSERLD